jgi:hypothetical protein
MMALHDAKKHNEEKRGRDLFRGLRKRAETHRRKFRLWSGTFVPIQLPKRSS